MNANKNLNKHLEDNDENDDEDESTMRQLDRSNQNNNKLDVPSTIHNQSLISSTISSTSSNTNATGSQYTANHQTPSKQMSSPANTLNMSISNSSSSQKEKKIGHREVKHGVVLYKKVPTDELKKSIQFGIVHFLNEQNRHDIDRDLLMQDFQVVDTIMYPKAGTALTPPHDYNDFKLKVYAPYGFRYLRRKFNVNELDFMNAIGETDLIEVSNPGASGSVFYKTSNDKYILKTVQYQECEFLKTLLAGYALVTRFSLFFTFIPSISYLFCKTKNLLQNLINGKFTLLPTIYGLFCYQVSSFIFFF